MTTLDTHPAAGQAALRAPPAIDPNPVAGDLAVGRSVLATESAALAALSTILNGDFTEAVALLADRSRLREDVALPEGSGALPSPSSAGVIATGLICDRGVSPAAGLTPARNGYSKLSL